MEDSIDTIKQPTNPQADHSTDQLTFGDIDVGIRLVDALVRHAATKGDVPIAYADLLTLTRLLHPKDAAVDRAVPVGIGMKLRFVEEFCRANAYPNLACLAVHPDTMRPATGYAGDPEPQRRAVAACDWTGFEARLAAFALQARAAVPKRLKPRKERPADVSWYAYFCGHREACKDVTGDDKKEIINLMMSGLDPENALRRVLAAKAEFAGAA